MPAVTKKKAAPKPAPAAGKPPKAAKARLSLPEVMAELERAGSAQTRKTYARHGAAEPMFGVSFATLKTIMKRIGVDHELACALWDTGNFDARNLAVKIVDPARMSPADLDHWAGAPVVKMCAGYVAHVAAEGPHGRARAEAWLAAKGEAQRSVAWSLVAAMAMVDEQTPDAWFAERLSALEKSIHTAPNLQRSAMLHALVAIGCRSAALRKAATVVAKRVGPVEIDHGDTACKTMDARESIDKTWTRSTTQGFATPAAHERSRESMRTRC